MIIKIIAEKYVLVNKKFLFQNGVRKSSPNQYLLFDDKYAL